MVDQAVHDTALAEIANLQNQLSASNLAKVEAFIKGQTAVIADFKEKSNTGHSSLPVLKPSKYNSNDNFFKIIQVQWNHKVMDMVCDLKTNLFNMQNRNIINL